MACVTDGQVAGTQKQYLTWPMCTSDLYTNFGYFLNTPYIYIYPIRWKVKLFLCLINYAPSHEEVWRSGGIAPPLLTSALDGGEWSDSRPGRFTPGEWASGIQWIGSWMGTGAGLDAMEKRKTSCSCQELNPGRPARTPSLYRIVPASGRYTCLQGHSVA
jgi:hypothetical protein